MASAFDTTLRSVVPWATTVDETDLKGQSSPVLRCVELLAVIVVLTSESDPKLN